MTQLRATGTFKVQMQPLSQGEPEEPAESGVGATLGRMSLRKQFEGDLQATGEGQMLTAMTTTQGSAGYVAIERVTGALQGRKGSFVLQHTGTMARGAQQLSITVVPDSGTGELAGLSGTLGIRIEGGQHFYDFDYRLDA